MSLTTFGEEGAIHGSALRAQPPRTVPGTILYVDPNNGACDVFSEGCYYSNIGAPNVTADPEGMGGSLEVPRQGQTVMLSIGAGDPTIVSMYPVSASSETAARPRASLTPVETSGSPYNDSDAAPRSGRVPNGTLPGDRAWIGNQGQGMGVLDGGMASMWGSQFARLDLLSEADTAKLAGRNLDIFTGFGQMRFIDDEGKASFVFEGGTDQLTQSGAGQSKFPIQFRIGGESEGLLDFHLKDANDRRRYSFSTEPDGTTSRYQAGNEAIRIGGLQAQMIESGRSVVIKTGNDTLSVQDGNRAELFEGSHNTETLESRSYKVGGSRYDKMTKNWAVSAGGSMSFSASGDAVPTALSNAVNWTVTNGSVNFDIGSAAALDNPIAQSSFKVTTNSTGRIELLSKAAGQILMDTTLPAAGIMVGGTLTSPAKEPAVLGLEFLKVLNTIMAIFDSHTHMTNTGVSLTPVPFLTTSLLKHFVPVLSKKVLIGA